MLGKANAWNNSLVATIETKDSPALIQLDMTCFTRGLPLRFLSSPSMDGIPCAQYQGSGSPCPSSRNNLYKSMLKPHSTTLPKTKSKTKKVIESLGAHSWPNMSMMQFHDSYSCSVLYLSSSLPKSSHLSTRCPVDPSSFRISQHHSPWWHGWVGWWGSWYT